jgi:hypothetical protein
MRILFFCLASMFLISTAAQEGEEKSTINLKSQWLIGGNAKIVIERAAGQTGRLIIEIEPQGGYFFTDWFAAGMRFPLDFRSNQFSIGVLPFTRFYLPTKKMIRPFMEVNGGREWRFLMDLSTQESDLERSWVIGMQLGAAFFIRNDISIDVFFYYTSKNAQTEFVDGSYSTPIIIEFIGLGMGFQIYL